MRICGLLTGIALGLLGTGGAVAADLPLSRQHATTLEYDSVPGRRAAPTVIYDFEPGTVIRAYWLPPWRDRHYFPSGGEMRRVAHRERCSCRHPRPAETFYRSWSTSVFLPERPRERAPVVELPPK